MVTHVLRRLDQRIHELHRADEVATLEGLRDDVALARPAFELAELRLDLLVGQEIHARSLCLPGSRCQYSSPCGSQASCPRRPRRSSPSASATTWSPSPTSATSRPPQPHCPA